MKILIAQTSFLGDVILSTPLISALSENYPGCELWMMTTPLASDLVARDPLLKGVITFDKHKSDAGIKGLIRISRKLKSYDFDIAYAVQRSFRTALLLRLAGIPKIIGFKKKSLVPLLYSESRNRPLEKHDVLRNLALVEDEPTEGEMRLFAPEELKPKLQSILSDARDKVIIAPGSAWETKRWSVSGYREVATECIKRGMLPIIIGSPSEFQIAEDVASVGAINLAGEITLAETIALIKASKLLITNDSMSLHMGSALKVPTVAIFCATTPDFGFGPWHNKAEVVEAKGLSCKPCARHGSRVCPNGTLACIKQVTAQMVIEAVDRVLSV